MQKTGYVALIGAPNAGKSTLLNNLIGQKISIVSRKVQTTRTVIRGVVTTEDTQIVFIDTPGIFRPKRRLDRSMVGAAWDGITSADLVILLIDAHKGLRHKETQDIIEAFKKSERKIDIAINKIDGFDRQKLPDLAQQIYNTGIVNDIYMISALTGSGTKDLMKAVSDKMPEMPFIYDPDEVSDIPLKFLAAEITREQLYDRLHDEIPYNLTVETEVFQKSKSGTKTPLRLEQIIFVTCESHRRILLGKQGRMIKLIGENSRTELAGILGRPVHLFLHIKVRESWQEDPERYQMMNLDLKSERLMKA
ncbi:MAG: GTP-binding protein Era [Alphaproteobacteria bacterium]|jgi:GTP-binding protein Era